MRSHMQTDDDQVSRGPHGHNTHSKEWLDTDDSGPCMLDILDSAYVHIRFLPLAHTCSLRVVCTDRTLRWMTCVFFLRRFYWIIQVERAQSLRAERSWTQLAYCHSCTYIRMRLAPLQRDKLVTWMHNVTAEKTPPCYRWTHYVPVLPNTPICTSMATSLLLAYDLLCGYWTVYAMVEDRYAVKRCGCGKCSWM